jgi:hypothetical protein
MSESETQVTNSSNPESNRLTSPGRRRAESCHLAVACSVVPSSHAFGPVHFVQQI